MCHKNFTGQTWTKIGILFRWLFVWLSNKQWVTYELMATLFTRSLLTNSMKTVSLALTIKNPLDLCHVKSYTTDGEIYLCVT